MKSTRIWVAGVIAALGVILGARALWQLQSTRAPIEVEPPPRNAWKAIDESTLEQAQSQFAILAETVAAATPSLGLSPTQRDRLAASVSEVLDAYRQESFSDVMTDLEKLGVQPSPYWIDNPDRMQERWRSRRTALIMAQLDSAATIVRRRTAEGPENQLGELEGLQANTTSRRDSGRPFLDQVRESDRVMIETVLRGTFVGENGDEFNGELGIEMTWNPFSETWVPTAFHSYEVPLGIEFRGPIP